MLIVDEKTLAATGLDFDAAVALLQPPADELIVRVKRELAPPAEPISSPVNAPALPQATERLHAATEAQQPQATTDARAVIAPSSDADTRGRTHDQILRDQIAALQRQIAELQAEQQATLALRRMTLGPLGDGGRL